MVIGSSGWRKSGGLGVGKQSVDVNLLNFCRSDFSGVILRRANLDGADLSGAVGI